MDESIPLPLPAEAPARLSGRLRATPEDFEVEEIPLYPPAGEGEHVFVRVEKRGLTTPGLVARLAERLELSARDVGWAGYKDRHAVTKQWLSLPLADPGRAEGLHGDGFRVLEVTRHANKLRPGHLRGNRFSIRVRDLAGEDPEGALEAVRALLERRGLPNAFGPQRFGRRGDNHLLGQDLVHGRAESLLRRLATAVPALESERVQEARAALGAGRYQDAARAFPASFTLERHLARELHRGRSLEDALRRPPAKIVALLVSAWQSAVFNRVLEARHESFDRLLPGDVAWKHANGACFSVENPEAEAGRVASFEISPTGPMPGRKLLCPRTEAEAIEAPRRGEALPSGDAARGLPRGARPQGTRRPLRVPVECFEARVGAETGILDLSFSLPAGSYATSLLALLGLRDDDAES